MDLLQVRKTKYNLAIYKDHLFEIYCISYFKSVTVATCDDPPAKGANVKSSTWQDGDDKDEGTTVT